MLHETVVSAYVLFPSETIGIVDASGYFTEHCKVVSATPLIKISDQGLVPVRLLNLNFHPINIYQNTALADFAATEPEIATYNLEIANDVNMSPETPKLNQNKKVTPHLNSSLE